MRYLYVSARVESRIAALHRAGKAGAVLAKKTTHIIESLTSGAVRNHMEVPGSFTKYGEKRIKNCRKYDLGCGYRLITLQRGETVFIPFLGTHDACQLWLEKNSRLKDYDAGAGRTIRVAEKNPAAMISGTTGGTDILVDDPDVFNNLPDKVLRRVFSGLVQGHNCNRNSQQTD